jgi:hypothetical protein
MAIAQIPKEISVKDHLACSICRAKLLLEKATAGLFDAHNHQAVACISHFSEVELLIVGWADFMAAEREKYQRQKREAKALGVSNAWLDT